MGVALERLKNLKIIKNPQIKKVMISHSDLQVDSNLDLILPSVSIGNVGQLAIDAILPVVGCDPLDLKSQRMMTACELYKIEGKLILQLRSGLGPGLRDVFIRDLLAFVAKLKVGRIVVLGSMDSEERLDCQIRGSQFRFLASKGLKSELEDCEFTELEARQGGNELFIPGGGYTKALYEQCLQKEIPIVTMLTFASEGNNAQDGLGLANYFNTWAKVVDKDHLKGPPSWTDLYGSAAPTSIYN